MNKKSLTHQSQKNKKCVLLLSTLLLSGAAFAYNDEKVNVLSMSIGGYSASYNSNIPYTIDGQSGTIPFGDEKNFGMTWGYSRMINSSFSLDLSIHIFLGLPKNLWVNMRTN